MHHLPPHNHPAREMFAVEDLVDVTLGRTPVLAGLYQAKNAARRFFEGADHAAKRVIYFCIDPTNDQLRLVSVGRRGGAKVEWTFGPCGSKVRLA